MLSLVHNKSRFLKIVIIIYNNFLVSYCFKNFCRIILKNSWPPTKSFFIAHKYYSHICGYYLTYSVILFTDDNIISFYFILFQKLFLLRSLNHMEFF